MRDDFTSQKRPKNKGQAVQNYRLKLPIKNYREPIIQRPRVRPTLRGGSNEGDGNTESWLAKVGCRDTVLSSSLLLSSVVATVASAL